LINVSHLCSEEAAFKLYVRRILREATLQGAMPIFVDSTPGAGACFTLILPVCSDLALPDTDAAAARRKPTPVQGSGVVLLVEDEAPVRAFASRALQMRGFSVIEAASAEEALALLTDPGLHVDLFVTDVVMPGLDGPSWVRRAREMRPDVGVVFVSGYAEGAFGGSLPDLGNSVFLPKPFSLAQLTETVRDQLAAAPVARPGPLQTMLS
jgi:two-component system cell cycle sensor histidine kinase/response regulator CckA